MVRTLRQALRVRSMGLALSKEQELTDNESMMQMNELAFYTLAGAPESPRDLIAEVGQGEELGLGSVFISERFNIKEAATLSGAVGAVSDRLGVATAATGSVESCVSSINEQFDMGVDGVILHGPSPEQLQPIVEHYPEQRISDRFVRMTNNPGGIA